MTQKLTNGNATRHPCLISRRRPRRCVWSSCKKSTMLVLWWEIQSLITSYWGQSSARHHIYSRMFHQPWCALCNCERFLSIHGGNKHASSSWQRTNIDFLATWLLSLLPDFCQTLHSPSSERSWMVEKQFWPSIMIFQVMLSFPNGAFMILKAICL